MNGKFDIETLRQLAHKWKMGTLTPEERAYLDTWEQSQRDDVLELPEGADSPEQIKARLYSKLQETIKKDWQLRLARRTRSMQPYYWAAALLLIGAAFGFYFFIVVGKSGNPEDRKMAHVIDIAPGYNQATLTLADGTTVKLDSAQSGIIIGAENIKYDNGSLVQNVMLSVGRGGETSGAETSLPNLLSLSTPKGGQYQIILSDGTKVWLNAASTLKYPSKFSGNSREVFLEGEAFFNVNNKVAGDRVSRVPFIVKSQNQEISVLGTSFNVDAYADEASVKTTLASGAVQVSILHTPYSILLAPGEQSLIQEDGKITKAQVDVDGELAWKNNRFAFHNEPLESIMRQVSRWYNVTIVYGEGIDKNEKYVGSFSRYANVSEVLKNLEFTGNLVFTIEAANAGQSERRIIISKKKN